MSRILARVVLVALSSAVLACGDGPLVPKAGVPAKVTKVAGDGQSATVATAVSSRPAVLVLDFSRRPVVGLPVTFRVAAGGGDVTGPDATTDSLGIATVGSWVLGTRSGTNTLAATVADTLTLTFTATGTAAAALTVAARPGISTTANVAAAPPVVPAVAIADAWGNPVPGVVVSFAITAGGGTITGGSPASDAQGVAAVGAWILGPVAGRNALRATVAGLTPVDFVVTGLAGPPASLLTVAGDRQVANAATPVDTAPAVRVRDSHGNGVSGITVTFSVLNGGGEVAGGTQTTDSNGTARVTSWKMGRAAGSNALVAAVPGTGLSDTLTALSLLPCADTVAYSVDGYTGGTLTQADCGRATGAVVDLYRFSLDTGTSFDALLQASLFSPHIGLYDANGLLVATSPYYCANFYCGGTTHLRLLAPSGTYVLEVSGFTYDYDDLPVPGALGPYSLTSGASDGGVTSCQTVDETIPVFIVPGATTSQRIDTDDCVTVFQSHDFWFDQFNVYLTAGRAYTMTMASDQFDTYLELWSGSTSVAANDDYTWPSTNSQFTFTPATSGVYVIQAGTHEGDWTGDYTLTVTDNGPAPAPAGRTTRAQATRPTGVPGFTPRPPKPARP